MAEAEKAPTGVFFCALPRRKHDTPNGVSRPGYRTEKQPFGRVLPGAKCSSDCRKLTADVDVCLSRVKGGDFHRNGNCHPAVN